MSPARANRPLFTLARVLTATSGRDALRSALPLFVALAIIGAIVLGKNGMRPRDLISPGHATLLGRLALWSTWLLVSTPAARALVTAPTTFFLRALPIARWRHLTVHGVQLGAINVPWLAVWTHARGALDGAAVTLAMSALQMALLARSRKPLALVTALALLTAIASAAPMPILLVVAAFALPVQLMAAWTLAPERGAGRRRVRIAGPPWMALALGYFVSVRRADPGLVIRATVLPVASGMLAVLVVRNNDWGAVLTVAKVSLAVATLPIAIVVGGFAGPVLDCERRIRWLLASTATEAAERMVASTVVPATVGLLAGVVHGALVASALTRSVGPAARWIAGSALWGASLGVLAACFARQAERTPGVDGTTLVARMAIAVVASWLAMAVEGDVMLAAAVVVAMAMSVSAARIVPPGGPGGGE